QILLIVEVGYGVLRPSADHSKSVCIQIWQFCDAASWSQRRADDGAVDRQGQHGADNGADEARALARPVPAHLLPEPAGKDGADDAEKGRHDEPARPGDEQLGNSAGEKPDDDDPEPMHPVLSAFML